MPKPLFPTGRLLATAGVTEAAEGNELMEVFAKHITGDWGEVCEEDWATNDWAVANDARILSAYTLHSSGTKIWIITEANRAVTTFLLPEEY